MALGAQVFNENCTRCHGLTGKGDGELVQSGQVTGVPDFTNPQTAQQVAPIAWFEIVTNGRLDKLMPPWGDKLSEAQRWAATMYVYTLANTPEQIAQGQTVWTETCADCHGESGEGTSKAAPLSGLLESSTTDLLKSLDNGIPDKMHSFGDALSSDDRLASLAYARTLTLVNVGNSPHEIANVPTPAVGDTNPQPATTEIASASSSVTGVVSGKVVNMTAGGTVPPDLTLNLHVISDQTSTTPGDILHTTMNPDGSYRFEDVPIQTGWQYVVTASYNGTAFNSEVVDGDPAHPQFELPLNIYEVEADPSTIQIDTILTMVQTKPQSSQLEVVQIFSFTNASDRVYLKQNGETQSSVSVRLPQGAVFEDFSGGSYLLSADGRQVIDTQPVLPGNSHVMHLAFTLPYSGSASIEQPMDYALNGAVEVMIGSDGLAVTGDGFTSLGTRQLGDRTYMSYGGNLSRGAGETLSYQVQGSLAIQPQQTGTATTPNNVSPIAYILIGAGLLAIGAAFGFFMRERVTERSIVRDTTPTNPQENGLMQQIAQLDVQFNEGKLSKSKYQRQRAALKSQLIALMKDKPGSNLPPSADPET
jgi:mono/diheme cytochrome c family protein